MHIPRLNDSETSFAFIANILYVGPGLGHDIENAHSLSLSLSQRATSSLSCNIIVNFTTSSIAFSISMTTANLFPFEFLVIFPFSFFYPLSTVTLVRISSEYEEKRKEKVSAQCCDSHFYSAMTSIKSIHF